MFFAIDENGIRVNAEAGEFTNCVCPACKKPVIQKRGNYKKHHFAHKRIEPTCPFENDEDYKHMSEWHRRIQGYFSNEQQEYIFTDEDTGEKHIADIYIKEKNTVLEIQYSPIKPEEFIKRTQFHLNGGRRIAWLFYEGWRNEDENSYNRQFNNKFGKLKKVNYRYARGLYTEKSYQWLYMRGYVKEHPQVYQEDYSVCVFSDTEGDVFHRVIHLDLEENIIVLSLHNLEMSKKIDVDEFFFFEDHWTDNPWKPVTYLFEQAEDISTFGYSTDILHLDNSTSQMKNQSPADKTSDKDKKRIKQKNHLDEHSEEYNQRYNDYEPDTALRMKKIAEKQNICLQQGKCPLCGGKLVKRKDKYGEQFYGCSNFPKCRFRRDIIEKD